MNEPQTQYSKGDRIDLPLSKLVICKDNPRRTKSKDIDPVLTASIQSKGLLQNLGVRPLDGDSGKFEVRFGESRLKSLRHLTKLKHFPKDKCFSCVIVSDDEAEAHEAAMAENIARKNMNPADEYEAFAKLEKLGLAVPDIAMRFGITERDVQQRLALGSAAPCVRRALRNEEISLDIAKLFAGCPDIARQERVFKAMNERGHFSEYSVRNMLNEGLMAADDSIVDFIGLDAYEAAGGKTEKDLFNDDVRILDPDLVYRLRDERLAAEAERLQTEGWSWVEAHEAHSHQAIGQFDRIHGKIVEPTAEEQAEIDRVKGVMEAFEAKGEDDLSDEDWDVYEAAEEKLSELSEVNRAFTPEQKAVSGCVIYPGQNGIRVHEGLVRKDDLKKAKAALAADRDAGDETGDKESTGSREPSYGLGLRADLAVFKAQALQAGIAGEPAIAVMAQQFVFVYRIFAPFLSRLPDGSTLSTSSADLRVGKGELAETTAASMLDRIESRLRTDVFSGSNWKDAWMQFKALSQAERDELTAFAFARTIKPMTGGAGFMDLIAFEAAVDIRSLWKPTGDNFFSRIKKDQLVAFLKETVGDGEAARLTGDFKAKKADIVVLCEGLVDETTPTAAANRDVIDSWAPDGMAFAEPSAPDPDDDDIEDDPEADDRESDLDGEEAAEAA